MWIAYVEIADADRGMLHTMGERYYKQGIIQLASPKHSPSTREKPHKVEAAILFHIKPASFVWQ